MRRWCGRSNKEHSPSDVRHETIYQSALLSAQARLVHESPVCLIERQRLMVIEDVIGRSVPCKKPQLWKIG